MTSLRYPYVIRTSSVRSSAVHPPYIQNLSVRYPHDIHTDGAPRQPYIYAVVLHSRDLRTCDGFSDGRCRAGIWPSRKGGSCILQVARATPHMHSGKSSPSYAPSLASSKLRYPYDIRISVRYPYDIHAYIRRNIHRNIHRTSHLHPTYIRFFGCTMPPPLAMTSSTVNSSEGLVSA